MTIRRRVAALEARTAGSDLSLSVRAWLGEVLSPVQQAEACSESAKKMAIDYTSISKEAREWLGL